jgi:hypothetical protein
MEDVAVRRRDRSRKERAGEMKMFRRHVRKPTATPIALIDDQQALNRIHTFVISLPWVVERPHAFAQHLRMFAVDCEPLELQRLWLVTSLGGEAAAGESRVQVILPKAEARRAEKAGWGVRGMSMPPDHILMRTYACSNAADTDALILTAYECAMSSDR